MIFPLIFPGLFIQILFQGYYFYLNLRMKTPSKTRKIFEAVGIIAFGFPFLAYYHHRYQKQLDASHEPLNQTSIFYVLLFAFQVFSIQNVFSNQDTSFATLINLFIGILCGGLFILFYFMKKNLRIQYFTLASVLIVLAIGIELLVFEFSTHLTLVIVLSIIMMTIEHHLMPRYAIATSLLLIATNLIKAWIKYDDILEPSAISVTIVNLVAGILAFLIFYGLKEQQHLASRLKMANMKLEEQQQTIERLTIEEERQRISHEIHDAVGHQLTTALIALESIQHDVSNDQIERVDQVRQLIKQGLSDIRLLIHDMKQDDQKLFSEKLDQLIIDLKQNTSLEVTHFLELHEEPQKLYQRIFMNFIKEFITNSIKHGHAKIIDILITESMGRYYITLGNDGIQAGDFQMGFGLKGVEETVTKLGGTITFNSTDGFQWMIQLPIPKEKEIQDER